MNLCTSPPVSTRNSYTPPPGPLLTIHPTLNASSESPPYLHLLNPFSHGTSRVAEEEKELRACAREVPDDRLKPDEVHNNKEFTAIEQDLWRICASYMCVFLRYSRSSALALNRSAVNSVTQGICHQPAINVNSYRRLMILFTNTFVCFQPINLVPGTNSVPTVFEHYPT